MPTRISQLSRLRRRGKPARRFIFNGFSHGLNTSVPSFQIAKTELADRSINYKINKGGQLESRLPINTYITNATSGSAAVKFLTKAPIGGTEYELIVDSNDVLYYVSGSTPVPIGTTEGETTLMPFKDIVFVLDGGYIKFLDGVESSNFKIAYDDGTGTSGYQFDSSDGDEDTSIALGNGTNTRVAYKFTSQTWTSGYTIPPTTVTFKLDKTGTPSGSMSIVLRQTSDDASLANATFMSEVSELSVGTVEERSYTFLSGDVTSEMATAADYYLSLEYDAAPSGSTVNVHCTSGSSGGTAYIYTGSWANDATKTPIASLRPGRGPKAAFGRVLNNRPFFAGDPDNPGYAHYGNLSHLDYSTADGGGKVGLVDDSSNNFPIGGMEVFLDGSLYIFGKRNQPALAKLTGSSPSSFALPLLYQRAWTTHKTLLSAINDIWFSSQDGTDSISGVQEFGDLRTFSISDPLEDRFKDYWDTDNAIAGYYPKEGQYWLSFPNYHRILVSHTKIPVQSPRGRHLRYPWIEYELYREELTNSLYFKWTKSGSGKNEYYVELLAGGDPSISTPDHVVMDGAVLTEGTVGSLSDHEYDYGDNDSLGYSTVYFADASGDPDTTEVDIRTILKPQCFASYDGEFLIGGSDGLVYKIDKDEYKDMGKYQVSPTWRSSYIELSFAEVTILRHQLLVDAKGGGSLTLNLYKNNIESAPATFWDISVPISDTLTLKDMTMDLVDATFLIDPQQTVLWRKRDINVSSFQFEMKDVKIAGFPMFVNGLLVKYRALEEE
ncbi:MAG: hypothetical protein GY774_35770 [Planctomycetes bacterium]|nr:hypothetical protein [Planctomycetota bacterium]